MRNLREESFRELFYGGRARPRYRNRSHAGRVLAESLKDLAGQPCTVLAVPNGGVPVGIEIARALGAELGIELVRKLQIPGNTEAGFGAMSLGGGVVLNRELVFLLGLREADIRKAQEATKEELERRRAEFGPVEAPVEGRVVVLTDDGLASGYTMLAAVRSVRARSPSKIVVAVPTAPPESVRMVGAEADRIVCPDVRSGGPFAVADAYEDWYDLTTREAVEALAAFLSERGLRGTNKH
ncbi:MAG: phosphoribosyltransferase family protein [Thermoplasmata archaeon]